MGWQHSRGCMQAAERAALLRCCDLPHVHVRVSRPGKHRKLRSACMPDITSSLPCSYQIIWLAAAHPQDVSARLRDIAQTFHECGVIKCSALQHLRGSVHPVASLIQGVRSRACHRKHSLARAMCLSGQPDQPRTKPEPMVLRARQQGRSPPSRTSQLLPAARSVPCRMTLTGLACPALITSGAVQHGAHPDN